MSAIKLILVYVGWGLLWAAVQVFVLWHTGLDVRLMVADALLTNLLIIMAGYAMGMGLKFYQPGIKQSAYLFGWSLGLAMICIAVFNWIFGRMYSEQAEYLALIESTLPVRIAFAWLIILLILLLSWLWFYTLEQQQDEKRKAATEKMAREAELFNLRQQLQPHFLFNSLNSISALVVSQPEQARKMVQQLSGFLRGTLRQDNQQQSVLLSEELQQLQLYLDIEKVRFGHRLCVQINADPESLSQQLPPLLLQPIVENAIKFGLYDTIGETTIKIETARQNGQLTITTQNPYDPTTQVPRKGTGFGLDSVRRRLYLLFARQDLLETSQENSVFTTTIKIPQKL